MQRFLIGLLFISSVAIAEEQIPLEMYMQNDDGGFVTLTEEKCEVDGIKDKFPFYAYATTKAGKTEEGCWTKPSIEGMPKEGIPIVNIWHDGQVTTFMQSWFSPEKKSDSKVVKGNL